MGRVSRGRLGIVAALAALSCLFNAAGASAETGAGGGQFVGTGTISPALTTSPQAVTGGISGTFVGAGVWGSATIVDDTCSFTFASSAGGDDIATGQGNVSGGCSGTASINANFSYTRVGGTVVGTGTAAVNGFVTTIIIVCAFVPTSGPAVGTFGIVCWPYIN